jgi:anti-anti-sigma factor
MRSPVTTPATGTASPNGAPHVNGAAVANGSPRAEVPTIYEFSATSSFSRLRLMPGLNEVQWGGVESLGSDLIGRLERAPSPKLLVDLTPLNYMGSSQVALLVRLWKTLKAKSGKMVVLATSDVVQKVLTIAGLNTLWDIVDTESEAYAALGARYLDVEDSGSHTSAFTWAAPLSVAFLAASVVLWFAGQNGFQSLAVKNRLGFQFGLGAAALAFALWAVARGAGVSRGLGACVAAASFVMAILTALQWPR